MAVQTVPDIAGESKCVIFAAVASRVDAERLASLQLGQSKCEFAPLRLRYRLALHALACILSAPTYSHSPTVPSRFQSEEFLL
jgi:hypothetical protein